MVIAVANRNNNPAETRADQRIRKPSSSAIAHALSPIVASTASIEIVEAGTNEFTCPVYTMK